MTARDLAATVREQLRDKADNAEKSLPFLDEEFVEETHEEIALWRSAADLLAALERQAADAQEKIAYVESCRDDMHGWGVRANATVRALRDQVAVLEQQAADAQAALADADVNRRASNALASELLEERNDALRKMEYAETEPGALRARIAAQTLLLDAQEATLVEERAARVRAEAERDDWAQQDVWRWRHDRMEERAVRAEEALRRIKEGGPPIWVRVIAREALAAAEADTPPANNT